MSPCILSKAGHAIDPDYVSFEINSVYPCYLLNLCGYISTTVMLMNDFIMIPNSDKAVNNNQRKVSVTGWLQEARG